jgi:hypothetical protein
MSFGGAGQRWRRRRRIEDRFGKCALILDRETDNLGFLDRTVGRFLRCCDHKVADTATLQFGCASDDSERIRRNPGLKPGGTVWFLG